MKIIFPLIIVCLFSFKPKSTTEFSALNASNYDSSIIVSVKFNDIASLPAYCGIMLVKADYKYKLEFLSRYAVISKDGIIRIQFTCPRETATWFLYSDRIYKFRIKPINQTMISPEDKERILLQDDIPMYEYVGRN